MLEPKDVSVEQIGDALGLSVHQLWNFANSMHSAFKPSRKQWVGKKHRLINAMYPKQKKVMRKLHRFLQELKLFHKCAHGGVKNRSTFSSARVHLGRPYVWVRDAKDCYPSITISAMKQELTALGFKSDTAELLSLLFTHNGCVPQGSPVSNDALNVFMWRIDHLMSSMAPVYGIRYSRVADDFVLSAKRRDAAEEMIARLEEELKNRGIQFNEKKIRETGLQTPSVQRLVHGINVSRRSGAAIRKDQVQHALSLADKYLAACKSLTADSIRAVAAKRAILMGWRYYSNQAEFGPVKTIRQKLDAGDRHVFRKLQKAGISVTKNRWWFVDWKNGKNEPLRISKLWKNAKCVERIQPPTNHQTVKNPSSQEIILA
jgi:Reverse transcriptase (RNA-dependent DNA polymerase)